MASTDDRGIYYFKEWVEKNYTLIQRVGLYENEEYLLKRKFLERTFPQFRIQIYVYKTNPAIAKSPNPDELIILCILIFYETDKIDSASIGTHINPEAVVSLVYSARSKICYFPASHVV